MPDDKRTLLERADETIRQGFGWTYDPDQKGWVDANGVLQLLCDSDDEDE